MSRITEIDEQIAKLQAEKQKIQTTKSKYSDSVQKHIDRNRITDFELNQFDYWDIYGEDSNCDLGGYHHEPFIETVHGYLIDVIKYAVTLKSFYSWGAGGRIQKSTRGEIKRL